MSYTIIDSPHPVSSSFYDKALDAMTKKLMANDSVISVYQAGGVSNPGISDLDMVVVFKNEVREENNFLKDLSDEERYLFIHNLYGISEGDFETAQRYSFYYNYKLLAGKELLKQHSFSAQELLQMKVQVALEFLLKFYITLGIQDTYRVIRMRDLLLHVKALHYDLEFLGISSGNVYSGIEAVLDWRSNWFKSPPLKQKVMQWVEKFYPALNDLLDESLQKHSFYLPAQKEFWISKNILLVPSSTKIKMERKGLLLPRQLSVVGKKYFRLQNMFNRFQFKIPIHTNDIPPLLQKKFHFEKKIVDYNRKYLPYFLPLTSSLHAV